jgi:hypothetical protein
MLKNNIFDAIEGLIIGVLATVVIVFGFQTRIPYPHAIVQIIEDPWIIVLAYIFAIIIGRYSPKISVLMLLLLTAFVIEVFLLTHSTVSEFNQQITNSNINKFKSPVDILSEQNTHKTTPNDNYKEEHKGYPLYDVLLPVQVYPLFDKVKIHSAT